MSQDVSQLCHKICRENVVRADGFTELGSIPKVTLDKVGPIWGFFKIHIKIIIYYQSTT